MISHLCEQKVNKREIDMPANLRRNPAPADERLALLGDATGAAALFVLFLVGLYAPLLA